MKVNSFLTVFCPNPHLNSLCDNSSIVVHQLIMNSYDILLFYKGGGGLRKLILRLRGWHHFSCMISRGIKRKTTLFQKYLPPHPPPPMIDNDLSQMEPYWSHSYSEQRRILGTVLCLLLFVLSNEALIHY